MRNKEVGQLHCHYFIPLFFVCFSTIYLSVYSIPSFYIWFVTEGVEIIPHDCQGFLLQYIDSAADILQDVNRSLVSSLKELTL